MLKILPIFGLFSLVISTFECSGVEKKSDNSWSLTGGAVRRNSSTGSTPNRSVAAATKLIKSNSSLQSTQKTSRQSSPFHRYSASAPGTPLLLKKYQPYVTQVNMSNCLPAKNYGSLFRSRSTADKNNESRKTLLTKCSTFPNGYTNDQNQQSVHKQQGLLSRFMKSFKKKGQNLASIEEEMPEKVKVNKEQMTTAPLEAQEKRKKKEHEKLNQTVREKQDKTVRGKQNQTVLEKQNQTVRGKQNQTVLEKQNQTVLGILQEKQNQTVQEKQNQTVQEKQNQTVQGKSKKPKSGKQQQTMPLESVEMPKKRVVLSNRKELGTFFEKADAKNESQLTLNEDCSGEASFRHFVNSDGKIEQALSSPTVTGQKNPDQAEKEEILGESSYRFSSSPDFLKKIEATSEDESSDKSSFGFPSPADSVPTTPAEPWWQIQSANGQRESVSG
ncbi:hypothetical protein niasHT_039926 [Heterodera trifolii]|uniref:Uncharacterized protein n=1 Tax=Heterodera trifolii TaxID=157864 RepID=A0ABD2IBG3_9BILA